MSNEKVDIRLDVAINMPSGTLADVVEHDLGKQTATGLQRKGFLCPPPTELSTTLAIVKSDHGTQPNKVSGFVCKMLERFPAPVEYKRHRCRWVSCASPTKTMIPAGARVRTAI